MTGDRAEQIDVTSLLIASFDSFETAMSTIRRALDTSDVGALLMAIVAAEARVEPMRERLAMTLLSCGAGVELVASAVRMGADRLRTLASVPDDPSSLVGGS